VAGLLTLTLGLLLAGLLLAHAGPHPGGHSSLFIWAIGGVFGGVGALVALRHPRNAIGWLCLGVGVSAGLSQLTSGYAQYWTNGNGGTTALGQAAAMYASLSWMPFILVPATYVLLLFPDGRLLSRRWRIVTWAAAIGIVFGAIATVLTPGPIEDFPELPNPYAVESPILAPLSAALLLLLGVAVIGSAASVIVRFRRASGEQRQQIKWLALAGTGVAVALPVGVVGYDVWGETVSNVLIMLSVLGLPAAAGVAILRYRLYDIDVIINRTVVYGLLTAALAASYLVSVLLLQVALRGVTPDSGLAVAASTLAVAALFRPARSRIQAEVDRRFFRQRFDAQRTLTSFSARLRDEIDLSTLDRELRSIVVETMHPSHVSLWLRVPPAAVDGGSLELARRV
jgi:MFS family permease